jgi:hypothetical protein
MNKEDGSMRTQGRSLTAVLCTLSLSVLIITSACQQPEIAKPKEERLAFTLGMALQLYVTSCLLANIVGRGTDTDFSSSPLFLKFHSQINTVTDGLGLRTDIPNFMAGKMDPQAKNALETQINDELRSLHGRRVQQSFELGVKMGRIHSLLIMSGAIHELSEEWRNNIRSDLADALRLGSTLGLDDALFIKLRQFQDNIDKESWQDAQVEFDAAVAPLMQHYATAMPDQSTSSQPKQPRE